MLTDHLLSRIHQCSIHMGAIFLNTSKERLSSLPLSLTRSSPLSSLFFFRPPLISAHLRPTSPSPAPFSLALPFLIAFIGLMKSTEEEVIVSDSKLGTAKCSLIRGPKRAQVTRRAGNRRYWEPKIRIGRSMYVSVVAGECPVLYMLN